MGTKCVHVLRVCVCSWMYGLCDQAAAGHHHTTNTHAQAHHSTEMAKAIFATCESIFRPHFDWLAGESDV